MLVLLAPPLALMMLLLGMMLGWYEQQREMQRLDIYHDNILQQLATLSAEPLYFFEYRVLETIADTAINSMNLKYILISDMAR
ncbi:MAG: hypothetical protein R3E95_14410 [Thiolinea sp.]